MHVSRVADPDGYRIQIAKGGWFRELQSPRCRPVRPGPAEQQRGFRDCRADR
jgi:hypothetical protein